jgi:hypothetical protein
MTSPKVGEFTSGWKLHPPATDEEIQAFRASVKVPIPEDLIDFYRTANGGSGNVGELAGFCGLFSLQEVLENTTGYQVSEHIPKALLLGTDGWGSGLILVPKGKQSEIIIADLTAFTDKTSWTRLGNSLVKAFYNWGELARAQKEDREPRLWKAKSPPSAKPRTATRGPAELLLNLKGQEVAKALSFSPDGMRAYSASPLCTWDLQTGTLLNEDCPPGTLGGFSVEGKVAITFEGNDPKLYLWSLPERKLLGTWETPGRVGGPQYLESANTLVFFTSSPYAEPMQAWIWDLKNEQPIAIRLPAGHSNEWATLAGDGETVALACREKCVVLLSLKTAKPVQTIPTDFSLETVMKFSPDSRYLMFGAYNRLILLDCHTGSRYREFQFEGTLRAAAITCDGSRMLTGCSTKEGLQLWDLQSGKEVWRMSGRYGACESLVISQDGRRALSWSGVWKSPIRLWQLPSK